MTPDIEELALRTRLLRGERKIRLLQDDLSEARSALASQASLDQLRSELEACGQDLQACRQDLEVRGQDLEKILGSARFRLGSALANALRSPREWRALIACIWELARGEGSTPSAVAPPEPPVSLVSPVRLATIEPPPRCVRAYSNEASEIFAVPPRPDLPGGQKELRVAAIMDPFSLASFDPECTLVPLHPDSWLSQLRDDPPHMLLVESAWTGIAGEWSGLVERAPPLLRTIVASCREAGVPTVFWNKEDPLHFDAFLPTARLFDHVFTTDAASVSHYRRELGHDRIGVLPFALQPRTHHPVGDEEREASSVFAGAWYGRMPERCADFERVADALALAGPLVIHDRNDGVGATHQRFPAKYGDYLRPGVPYEETPAVFRRHRIGVNLNTIKQSPTMFARRALELIGCNTSVYGNHALGLGRMFGQLTVASNDPEYLLAEAWRELRDPDAPIYRQRRLCALRKVLREHTWAHRVETLACAAFGDEAPARSGEGRLWVIARADSVDALARLVKAHSAQRGVMPTLALSLPPGIPLPEGAVGIEDADPSPDDWIAAFHADDHYGPHYLEDLALARAFCLGDVLGKGAWFVRVSGEDLRLENPECEYRHVEALAFRRSIWRRGRCPGPLEAILDALDEGELQGPGLASLDTMHYVAGGAGRVSMDMDDPPFDQGVAWRNLAAFVADMPAAPNPGAADSDALDGAQLAHVLNCGVIPHGTSASPREGRLEVCSLLEEGIEDAMFSAPLARDAIERDGRVEATLQAVPASQMDFYLDALDEGGEVTTRISLPRGVPSRLDPLAGTSGYRIAVRLRGRFVRPVDGLWMGGFTPLPMIMPGRGRLMLVCNGYPDESNLYRNAFVHRRVLAYRARGVGVDVVWASEHEPPRSFEFEGVPVQVCDPATLAATLRVSGHAGIAVHTLDPVLWSGVAEASGNRRVVVWLHGAEIQPWTRRAFNYEDEVSLQAAMMASDLRMEFWRRLLAEPPPGLHLVFVSRRFAEDAWEDVGMRLPDDRWDVIHNPIDTDLFAWSRKPVEQRFHVLSIRPHASRIYANDLVAATIRILSEHALFPKLRFTLVGDGPRWEEDFAGLESFANVGMRRGFLRQQEIASLHRRHGIFLVPTRGDTQGVSRDEAMSSGLIPITCDAGAVGEFVDGQSGILCPTDDPEALAAAIVRIAEMPGEFVRLSEAAARRVRVQAAASEISAQELLVLGFPARQVGWAG